MLETARDLFIASPRTSFLATVAWQSTLWLALGLFAGRLLRRQAAKAHLAVVLATVAAVASPLLTASVRQMNWGVLPAHPSERWNSPSPAAAAIASTFPRGDELSATPVPTVTPERIEKRDASPSPELPLAPPAETARASNVTSWIVRSRDFLPAALAGSWMLVSLTLALRLTHSIRLAQRTAAVASNETSPELAAALDGAAHVLGLKHRPRLCLSSSARSPMIWCWGSRVVLLLPESAAKPCGVNWRSIFCHELAHLVRRDHWTALWTEVLVIALPWQPLAWRSRWRLAFLREQACDDWALAVGGEAIDYAESLLNLVPQRSPVYALAAVTNAETLKQRLAHVLAGVRIAPKAGRRWIVTAPVISVAAAAGIAFAQQRTASATKKDAPAGEIKLLPSKVEDGDVFTVRGRVLKPDGQPAGGARLSIVRYYFDTASKRLPVVTGQAGPGGEFELAYRKSQILEGVARPDQWRETSIVAEADGFGMEWIDWKQIDPAKPLELRLVPDVPIHGRVVDLQGQPVSGVRVALSGVEASTRGRLDDWLAAVKKGATPWVAWPLLGRSMPPLDARDVSRATTDRDGRFTISGMGGVHVVSLELRGENIAYKSLTVATRTMSPLTQEIFDSGSQRSKVFGNDFTVEAAPTQSIIGTVRDAATGQPLAGVAIESWLFAGEKIGGIRVLRAESDDRGRYRLVGMPKGPGNQVMVMPNDDQPYFMRKLNVPSQPGSGPATLDIELHRGLWIIGRVTDRVTKQPVLARLHYLPFRKNSYVSRLPEFDRNGNVDGDQHRYQTRPDGTFRIPGMPGRAIVGAEAILASYRQGVGADAIQGKDKNGNFDTYRNPVTPGSKWPDGLVEINPAATAQAATCELALDAGQSIQMRLADPNGHPVTGCEIQGRHRAAWDNDAPAVIEVVNLAPGDVRTLVIKHEKRGLGKFVVIKFDEKTPPSQTVQLEPSATIAGRLVDEDGVAMKGVTLVAHPLPGGDFWPRLSPIVCQPDGTFEYKDIPTGCSYSLLATGQSFGFQTAARKVAVTAGKTTNLGDIKLKRRE